MTINNDITTIQSYIDKKYITDDSIYISQEVYLYMLEENIECNDDNIHLAIQDVYYK